MPQRKSQPERWSMWPSLHEAVLRLTEDDDLDFVFHLVDDAHNTIKEYDTTITGRFICHNKACQSSGWSSKKIAITIRQFPNQAYNARVYHQRCKSCNWLSKPLLDESYAERVSYRLKKWSGLAVEPPTYTGQGAIPHESDLCEGCRNGRCSWSFLTTV
jgi:hypothetical protein